MFQLGISRNDYYEMKGQMDIHWGLSRRKTKDEKNR